jgi:predicted  nucleic acid-binding Zn-ribbon protein
MPHQCLQCGKVFPSGSSEILKGCSVCGGKRFFYTEEPISSDQREVLKEQANQDVKSLIRDMLTQREPFTKYTSDDHAELGRPKGEEWVKVTTQGKPKSPSEPPLAKPVKRQPVDEAPGPAEMVETEVKEGAKVSKKGKLKPIRTKRRKPLKRRKVPRAKKVPVPPEARIKVKEIEPDIINILEPGVYEIDLKRLLEESPIIVQKEGTYFVHLPSVFEKVKKKS